MVGVAGRSKRCHTCRKRKVKCDEAKPVCYRCSRAGLECLGYVRQREFKAYTPGAVVYQPDEYSESAENRNLVPPADCRLNWTDTPRFGLSLEAYESDLCFARLFDNFVWASLGIGWMHDAATGRCGALPLAAIRALSKTNLGRLEHESKLKRKGAELYGEALRATADALMRPCRTTVEPIMLSILVLVLFGLYYPYRQWEGFLERGEGAEEEHDWGDTLQMDRAAVASHVNGLARLIYFCGPKTFQSPRMRRLFDCARMLLTVAAVYKRKRLQLEQYQWRNIPWALESSSKTEQSKLFDIFVMIPGFLEEYEHLSPGPSGKPFEVTDSPETSHTDMPLLADRITTQLQLLFRWRWEWQHRYGNGIKLVPQTQDCQRTNMKGLGGNRLDFAFPMDSMVRATEIALYNAILLWLLALLWNTGRHLVHLNADVKDCAFRAMLDSGGLCPITRTSSKTTALDEDWVFEPLSAPGRSVGLRKPALEICRVYEWQSRHHRIATQSTEPILLYIYPLCLAMSVLKDEEEATEWVTEMVTNSPITSGYRGCRFKMLSFSQLLTKTMLY